MASYNPPSEQLPIFDNAVFNLSSPSSYLTIAQANLLYLRKTYPDTATALETFSAGITTDTINTTTTSSTLNIASNNVTGITNITPNLTSGSIYIGANSTATNARTGIIHIGDSNSLTTGAVHINNGTNNQTNTQIMNGTSTSGTCNILTGTTSSGVVNLATGTGSSTVNIASGSTTGIVSIGNASNSVTFGGPLNLFYAPSLISSIGLGYKFNGTSTGITSTTTGVVNNFSKIILTSGVWLLMGNTLFVSPGTQIQLSISSSTSTATVGILDLDCLSNMVGIGFGTTQVSRVINTSVNPSTWYLAGISGTGTSLSNVVFYAVRIA